MKCANCHDEIVIVALNPDIGDPSRGFESHTLEDTFDVAAPVWTHKYVTTCYNAQPPTLLTLDRDENKSLKSYLVSMLERNVFFYSPSLWRRAIQADILDRGLVTANGLEHTYLTLLVEQQLDHRL